MFILFYFIDEDCLVIIYWKLKVLNFPILKQVWPVHDDDLYACKYGIRNK
jgi:hypothetical protein